MTYRGLYTAIITPFGADGEIDFSTFANLIDAQCNGGVDGIVVTGSTGETATLSVHERESLWAYAVEQSAGRVPIIAGSGSNDTRSSVEMSKRAVACGAHGLLVVTPYYNKPTAAGQIAHFRTVADAVDVPVILYNVPGRTATNMSAATQLAIAAACPNVVATKEASADLEQMCAIMADAPAHFTVLAGDDSLALPIIACGGTGVIAVVSNYAPKQFGRLVHEALNGNLATARNEQYALMPLFAANFLESNPIPVKYIMELLGLCKASYRLPLVGPSDVTKQKLAALFTNFVDA